MFDSFCSAIITVVLIVISSITAPTLAVRNVPYTPLVIMHGIASDVEEWSIARRTIERNLPGIYLKMVEIGNGKIDSMFGALDEYINEFIEIIQQDEHLAGGFNLAGHSQGAVVARAYIEMVNDPPVRRFSTIVGPQAGFFCPENDCPVDLGPYHEIAEYLVSELLYTTWGQDNILPAGYWRDPFQLDLYRSISRVLPYLNNEDGVPYNETYRQNMLSLERMQIVWSEVDGAITPWQSTRWEFYDDNTNTVLPLKESILYKEDRIGLRELEESGRIDWVDSGLPHTMYRNNTVWIKSTLIPFFNTTEI